MSKIKDDVRQLEEDTQIPYGEHQPSLWDPYSKLPANEVIQMILDYLGLEIIEKPWIPTTHELVEKEEKEEED